MSYFFVNLIKKSRTWLRRPSGVKSNLPSWTRLDLHKLNLIEVLGRPLENAT